jgi:nucleotide-binding universal stress UspA family protein
MKEGEERVSHIICAVRSRPGAEETVHRAIQMALDNGARLTFLQIVDADFLVDVIDKRASLRAIYGQLSEMADFTMTILCEQATLRGVREVRGVVRSGQVRAELLQFVSEQDADVLVMGRPTPSPGPDRFDEAGLLEFVSSLERAGTLRVYLPPRQ